VFYSFQLLSRREVGVPSGHVYRLVSHQVLHGSNTHTRHNEPTRKRMPKIVPGEVMKPGLGDGILEPVTVAP